MKKQTIHVWSGSRMLGPALAFALAAGSVGVSAQQKKGTTPATPAPPAAAQEKGAKGTFRLQVNDKVTPATVTLKANEAPMTEIAAELGRKLKVPVTLSLVMQKQKVTMDFSVLPLDAALRTLAPVPYVDYEVTGDFSTPAKPLAVYLNALNEPPPAGNASIKSNSEALLIEGDTEEGTEGYEKAKEQGEVPVVVSYARNQLTVRAKRQPLVVVLFKVANELGVPFDLRADNSELVDVNFTNTSLDQAIRSISPSVRFYYRADLQNFEIHPLRIALDAPART